MTEPEALSLEVRLAQARLLLGMPRLLGWVMCDERGVTILRVQRYDDALEMGGEDLEGVAVLPVASGPVVPKREDRPSYLG